MVYNGIASNQCQYNLKTLDAMAEAHRISRVPDVKGYFGMRILREWDGMII